MTTRRSFLLGPGALAWACQCGFGAARIPCRFGGIEVGLQSHCFSELPLEKMLDAAASLRFGSVELTGPEHIEPMKDPKERWHWRPTADEGVIRKIRRKVEARGIIVRSLAAGVRPDWTDVDVDRLFRMARALGVDLITSSSNVGSAARLEGFAKRYRIRVAFHNHSVVKPDEFATERDFEQALAGRSELLGINLDAGHYSAAGFDAADLVRKHHQRIYLIHLKDRKNNDGPQVNFGEGDTPLREILLMLKRGKWDIPCMIEHVVQTGDTLDAVRYDYEWTKEVLDA